MTDPYQLMPDQTPEEFAALKADIAQHGILVPVEVDDAGNILDGHHRVRAWKELRAEGIQLGDYPRLVRPGMTEEQKRNHVRSLNMLRRHLSKDQLVELMRQMRADGAGYQEIADAAGVSYTTAYFATVGTNELINNHKLPGRDGKARPAFYQPRQTPGIIATTEKAEQQAVKFAASLPADFSGSLVTVAEAKHQMQTQRRQEMVEEKRAQPWPAGSYQVVYADPPWRYDNSGFDEAAEGQYPTMDVLDICLLPISSLVTDSSVLFLWATNPLLPEAMQVLAAWGFSYKTNMAWVKDRGRGKGWFLKSKHELLLIGTRSQTMHPKELPDSCFEAARGPVHSRKPEIAYEIIERMYDGPRIELFARQRREGWDVWGNERGM